MALRTSAPPRPPAPVTAPVRRRPRARNRWAPWVFLGPWGIGLVLITLGPMIASLILSFTNYNLLGRMNWVGLANYARMFTDDPRFTDAAWVTLRYVVISVPLQLAFALAIAMLLNTGLRGQGFYRSVYYLPSLLGTSVAVALLWRQIFGSKGLVN
jgi:multiple sugar transport system permease protein